MSDLSNNNSENKNEQIQKSILICGILSMIIIIILVISIIIYCICKNRKENKNIANHNIFVEEQQQKKIILLQKNLNQFQIHQQLEVIMLDKICQ